MEDLRNEFIKKLIEIKWVINDGAKEEAFAALTDALSIANSVIEAQNTEFRTLQDRYNEMEKVLKEYAPMELLKLKLEKKNPNVEYELYTAQRKCGDASDMDEEWEYVDFSRGDYIEQTLYRRKRINPTNGE